MGYKIEAGCGIRQILRAGYEVTILAGSRSPDALIFGIVLTLIAGRGI